MSRSRLLPWLLLAIWTTWIAALQGLLRDLPLLAPWVPDGALVLLLVLASRLETGDLPRLALVVALGRIAVSVEPPATVLAGTLAAVLVVRGLRSIVEVDDALMRTALALLGVLLLARWQGFVLATRTSAGASFHAAGLSASWAEAVEPFGPHAWSRAAATALLALLAGPAFAHLPGLTPLRKRRTWHRAASARSW